MRRISLLLACLWSMAVSLYLLHARVYRGIVTVAATPTDGPIAVVPTVTIPETLLETHGPWMLAALAFPVAVAKLALLAPAAIRFHAAVAAAVLVSLFVVAGAMTVGPYYLPTVLLLLLGAFLPERLNLFRRKAAEASEAAEATEPDRMAAP